MLKVDQYARIREAHRDGMSIREIARTFNHSRRKIRQVLREPVPRPYTLAEPRPARVLSETHQRFIDEIIDADKSAPPKQRHTRKRIFERLRAEQDYDGGYDAVRRYFNRHQVREVETFLPIAVDAGQRAEADFGQIDVDFPEGRRKVSVLLVTWAYSGAVFAIALPSEKTEAILHGTCRAFGFFGCVPRELWWDNPKTVATSILKGRQRELNANYQALASHYNFTPLFCMPARGNEKPRVEGRVKWMKRNWATPVPQVKDLDELNAMFLDRCRTDQDRTIAGKEGTIRERLAAEREQAVKLPSHAFDACVMGEREVDKYQTVAWEQNRYSVPRSLAFQKVTVKAYVNRVVVVAGTQQVASHERSYDKGQMLLDPIHYLATLGRKPAYLDHTEVYRQWRLPAEIAGLREYFAQHHGSVAGDRQFIQVLQLLADHSQQRIIGAIKHCRREGVTTAQRIIFRCGQLAEQKANCEVTGDASITSGETLPSVQVPRPDLSRFDQFLQSEATNDELPHIDQIASSIKQRPAASQDAPSITAGSDNSRLSDSQASSVQGGTNDDEQTKVDRQRPAPASSQPQATASADDASRASQAGSGGGRFGSGLPGVSASTDRVGTGHPAQQCLAIAHPLSGLSALQGTRSV